MIEFPRVFEDLFKPYRYKVYYGGRGGAKSWQIARALLICGIEKQLRILCTRELQKSITDSVHRLLSDQIYTLQYDGFYDIKQHEILGHNGTQFIFSGIRNNVHEIKSMEGVDICWVEEAQRVSEESWKVLIPTIRKEGSEIWISFNPDSIDDSTYKRFILSSPKNSIVKKVTYKDNPWFTSVLKAEMEYDKSNDYNKYLHVWEGEPAAVTDALIFKDKFQADTFESPKETDVTYRYGADWGFAKDPSVLIRTFIRDGFLFVDYEAYGVGVDIDKTPAMFDAVPCARKYVIKADSARPETISYMNRSGYRIVASKKGKGSIEDGIQFMRSFKKIIIHERCKHTLDDFKFYCYKTDRVTGEVLPVIVDAHNNCIDSIRYANEDLMRGLNREMSVPKYRLQDILFK